METESQADSISCVKCGSKKAFSILPECLHCLCHECSAEAFKDDIYTCPSCSRSSKLVVKNAVLSRHEAAKVNPQCSWCKDNGENKASNGKCVECDIWLCTECIKGHNRMPPLRSHTIEMCPLSPPAEGLLCDEHPKETLELFCEECKVLTCRDCQLSTHRDHSGHKWVGEKAGCLKPELQCAVETLLAEQASLTVNIEKARNSLQPDSALASSVESTKELVRANRKRLLAAIEENSEKLIKSIDERHKSFKQQLEMAASTMLEARASMNYVVGFANRLIGHADGDPASLVQLSSHVLARIHSLTSLADQLTHDSGEAVATGWRESVESRARFHHGIQCDFAQLVGSVQWTREKPKPSDSESEAKSHNKCMTAQEQEEFLATLAEQEQDSCQRESCAVCFKFGVMAKCVECRRHFHLDCHLPRLTDQDCFPTKKNRKVSWTCAICHNYAADLDEASSAKRPRRLAGLTEVEYIAGCRILLHLLVLPQCAYFTSNECPACGVDLSREPLNEGEARQIDSCGSSLVFHRLFQLRQQLERSRPSPEEGAGAGEDVKAAANLKDWLSELTEFFSHTSTHKEKSVGVQRAATALKDELPRLVERYWQAAEAEATPA